MSAQIWYLCPLIGYQRQYFHLVVRGPTAVRDVFYASEQMLLCSEDRAHDCAFNLFVGHYYYL